MSGEEIVPSVGCHDKNSIWFNGLSPHLTWERLEMANNAIVKLSLLVRWEVCSSLPGLRIRGRQCYNQIEPGDTSVPRPLMLTHK